MRFAWPLLLSILCALGCRGESPNRTATKEAPEPARLAEISRLEAARDARGIAVPDLANRDVRVRRRALRALSRISDIGTLPALQRALADDDPEVVAWAAFGLGRLCSADNRDSIVERLTLRVATLPPPEPISDSVARVVGGTLSASLDPFLAIGDAMGRCGSAAVEESLRAWLGLEPQIARAAIAGLGRMATGSRRLLTPTIVALLDRSDGPSGLGFALYPISRLAELDDPVGQRLLGLAPRLIDAGGEGRSYALRAMAGTTRGGVEVLSKALYTTDTNTRTDAARALGRMGEEGQRALGRALSRVAFTSQQLSSATVISSDYLLLVTILAALAEPSREARDGLDRLAELKVPKDAPLPLRRRIACLRCRARALLASNNLAAEGLRDCDLGEYPREAKLAALRVLERGALIGSRARRFAELAADEDPRVVIAALELLRNHPEYQRTAALLSQSLGRPEGGVVATSARLAAHFAEASRDASQNESMSAKRELVAAVEKALLVERPKDASEIEGDLIDAAGALGILTAKPRIEKACRSSSPLLRARAERALGRLSEPQHRCTESATKEAPSLEAPTGPASLVFYTDIGPFEIRLDPSLAPMAVARVVDLARTHFYDGVVIHRVVPGAIVQLGDRNHDGFGGSGRAPLPCELSPLPFGPGSVGMALSGPDTGSSQFFVSLGENPQFAGEYALIGHAEPGWERLAEGDRVERVELVR